MNIDFLTIENFPVSEVEKLIKYKFRDKALLKTAFTRSTYAHEHGNIPDNDRLEFLGDSVLGLIVSAFLYKSGEAVGKLTEQKKKIVSSVPLSYVCEKNGFYKYLIMGHGDKKQFSLKNRSLLEDLTEALIGAIYLDGGYTRAERFVNRFILSDESAQLLFKDYVSELKEFCEQKRKPPIRFVCEQAVVGGEQGFRCLLYIGGELITEATAEGAELKSKQSASQKALAILKKKEN